MTKDGVKTVAFPVAVHSVDAVKRAAYVLMARAIITIEPIDNDICCTVEPVPGEALDRVVSDFRREVLDQDLRIEIEAKTEPLRNMILGLAFSRVAPDG